mmetsp:Transcript_2375/g.1708  ORF Transcript_2375/g.1708 Transcript_2375/m.1708 type:complete len:142 (+) Transcript_2375:632-1057(+)
MKYWIGGAYKTSTAATIFAQLYINNKCYGPHAFVIALRDPKTKQPLPGITLGDCGIKSGFEGIDNGFIIFKDHRIPKANLLNRFSDVLDDGTFVSEIKSHNKRFGLQLSAISAGRILLTFGNQQDLSYALKIAIRYAAMRL